MRNFKSFADQVHVDVELTPSNDGPIAAARAGGCTGSGSLISIIGPNGSGKSSIADSVLFVLGASTHDIRAKSIESLISVSQHTRTGPPTRA